MQPATQIFNLFDDLMILKSGKIVYHGPADEVVNHYAEAGFPCPVHTNPADHVCTIAHIPAHWKTGAGDDKSLTCRVCACAQWT